MKKLFTLLVAMSMVSLSYAQPDGEIFPDFTVTDIQGNSHHLQSYLDDDKVVLIDVFATWCSICISSLPAVDELYETHGPDGDNTLVVLAFEKDPNTSNEAAFASTYNVPNPIIANAVDVIADWNTIYQPNFFVVCPDGTFDYHFSGVGSSTTVLEGLIDQCESISTGIDVVDQEVSFVSNPIDDRIVFELKEQSSVQFSLIDMSGKVLKKGLAVEQRNEINVSDLEQGLYLLQIYDQNNILSTHKLVKR